MDLNNIWNKEKCSDSENRCPICNSKDIVTIDSYINDDYYVYKCTCSDCDCEFKEFHRLNYECTEFDFTEILFAAIKKFFGDDSNISVKEENIVLINGKEVEIYNDNEYKKLDDKSRIIQLPDSKNYFRFKNVSEEDERTNKLITIRNLLCEHLNLNESEIILPDEDNYDDEFKIKLSNSYSQIVEVLTKNSAEENEKDFGDDFINTTERVGAYRQLCNSDYYFRWM